MIEILNTIVLAFLVGWLLSRHLAEREINRLKSTCWQLYDEHERLKDRINRGD